MIRLLGLCLVFFAQVAHAGPSFVYDRLNLGPSNYPTTLKADSDSKNLSVLWWNIREGGRLSKTLVGNPLEQNLQALALSPNAPEVLALGEYMPGSLSPETRDLLKARYPYRMYYPDANLRREIGIKVYSQYPFTGRTSLLDWSPFRETQTKQWAFKRRWREAMGVDIDRFYERAFIDLTIQKADHEFHVIPVHMLNPWLPILSQIGKTKAGLVMMFGQDNPHYRQLERLIVEKVKPVIAIAKSEGSGLVLIGDFNLPDEVYGISPIGFDLMTSYLRASVGALFSLFTFPAVSSDMTAQPELRIDHAFVNHGTHVLENERLPFRGSDHYPIGIKVQLR